MSNTLMKMKMFNIGTLNVRGCKDKSQQEILCSDAAKYNLQILGITETHVKEGSVETMTIKYEGKATRTYKIFHAGIEGENNYSGVGIVIEESLNPRFKRITDRIATACIKINNNKHVINIIVAYAPTLIRSEKDPILRDNFYEVLDETIRKHKKDKHMLFLLGDMNAKTGSGHHLYPENMGKYGKGELNSNGEYLLDLARENKLILTNTLFPHRLSHRTTWMSNERIKDHKHADGTNRRNPYRNQIDYIITKKTHRHFIKNSRSYSGIDTFTDHKLVKAEIELEWWRLKKQKEKTPKINIGKLENIDTRNAYSQQLYLKLVDREERETPNEAWERLTSTVKEVASETLGSKGQTTKKVKSAEIEKLSLKQKKLRDDAEASTDKESRRKLKSERNKVIKNMKEIIKTEENKQMDEDLKLIEKYKDDSNKCYQAVRFIKSKKPKKPLEIFDEERNLIGSEEEQIIVITKYFQKLFLKSDEADMPIIKAKKMEPPFHHLEIEKAAKKLKNNRSTGSDGINAELIKYAPEIVYRQIAEILNETSDTGNHPQVLKHGLLAPLAKPKKKDENVNVRPIILLSILRKILTIILIDRCWDRLKTKIPISQAAYQSGRSTTEQVFTMKIMTEKAIISEDYEIYLMLLDMSKAFDTVSRPKLMEFLSEILTECELHMIYILIHDIKLNVKLGEKHGETINTNVGITQGDCLSALLFIFYLGNVMKPVEEPTIREDHSNRIIWSALDWVIPKDKHYIEINPKYADDISFIRSDESKIKQLERVLPEMLKKDNLHINKSKTEKYTISRTSHPKWKTCKYLGSLFDTKLDIKRRKGLLIDAYNTLEYMFKSRHLSEKTKLRIFKAYLESVFLYNSELWCMTKTISDQIDSFHRKQLRRILNIRWPKIITNKELYKRTKQIPWSKTILKRRLKWFGHVLRLPKSTPARIALDEFTRPVKKPPGRPKTTWLDIVFSDIKQYMNIILTDNIRENLETLEIICTNREYWNYLIGSTMLELTNVQ